MKKGISFLLLLAISAQGFCANVEFKTGYFFFSDHKMQKIYDQGGLDLQLCGSYPLQCLSDNWSLNAYGAVEYYHMQGKSINGDENTSLWVVPVNLGIKPVYSINCQLKYYFTVGPRYFYVHQHNDSSYVYRNKSRNGLGFFINTGFNYILCNNLLLDIFGEYSYTKIHFQSYRSGVYTRNIQVGGFTFGGGLGYNF